MSDDTRPGEDLTAAEEDTVIEARRAIRDGNAFPIKPLLDIIERLAARPTVAPGDDLAALRAAVEAAWSLTLRESIPHGTTVQAYRRTVVDRLGDLRAALRVAPGDGDGLREAAIDKARQLYQRLERSSGGMMQDDIEALGDALAALDPEAGD